MNPLALAQAAGNLVGGIGNFLASRTQAKRLRAAARDEDRSGVADRNRQRDEIRSAIGEQLVAQVSNGLEGGTGTALDALRQSQIEGVLDVLEMRRQSMMKARSLRQQAKDTKRAGTFALIEGVLGAGSSAYKAQNDWAQERRADG